MHRSRRILFLAVLLSVLVPFQAAALTQSTYVAIVPSPNGANHGGQLQTNFPGMTFTNLAVADINSVNLPSFDTVVLFQVCDVNTALTGQQKTDLLNWVSNGNKLLIWDSECSASFYPPTPDYSWLPFPFTSSNPGPLGALCPGCLSIIEEDSLACSDPSQPCYVDTADIASNTDAVGDMNVMIAGTSQWCIGMAGHNILGGVGPVQAYQKIGAGLIIWNGLDTDYINFNSNLAKVWELNLLQPFNPATGLPCVGSSGHIELTPVSVPENPPGTTHTITATVFDSNGSPVSNVTVTFDISGPNTTSSTASTDLSGVATCSYTGFNLGTDVITARASVGGQALTSNFATKAWGPVKLEPVDATNPVGTSHTLIATVVDLSQPNPPPPLPNVPVTFQIVGVHPTTFSATTDANGQATLTYTGQSAGLDAALAIAYIGGNQFPSNYASKRWVRLAVEPKTATNPVGTSHTVTATAYDSTGGPMVGVIVDFDITGANTGSCQQTSDSNGQATCSYVGQNLGVDEIVAQLVDPTSGQTITSDPAFKTWISACTIPGVTISNTSWNSFTIPSGTHPVVWVNAHIGKPSGIPTNRVTEVGFTEVSLSLNGTPYALPDGVMIFDPSAPATITTTFSGGLWQTLVNPNTMSDEMFFTGAAIPLTAAISSKAKATLSYTVSSASAFSFHWQWSAAAYTYWPTDWNQAQILPYHKSYHAGTPLNTAVQKSLIQGPRGGAGSNFTGSWSATGTATCGK